MGSGKNRVNVIVDDEAKQVLLSYQTKARINTRDEAVELILHSVPNGRPWRPRTRLWRGRSRHLKRS